MKQKIGVVFGGASSEYEISLMSAVSVLKNLDKELFEPIKIGIAKDGRMFYFDGDVIKIEQNTWEKSSAPCVISPDPTHHGILMQNGGVIRLDAVFPVLHGKNGEDGTIQGLLTMAQIPFVGCDTFSCAACMNKAVTHILAERAGIKSAKWISVNEHDYRANSAEFIGRTTEEIGYPCFVKPANAGSSVGISKVKTADELIGAMELALKNDSLVLCEQAVTGRELECAVLGNDEPIASCVGEILSCNEFYDYDAKYIAKKTVTKAPADIESRYSEEIRESALTAFKALGCSGLARVDFFLNDKNEVVLNELNTMPGFTSISMYSQLFAASGIEYPELITRLIRLASERAL